MQSFNKSLPKELNLPSNPHDIVEKFLCDSNNQHCMNSECNNCKLPDNIAKSGAFETDYIKFDEWRQVDRTAQSFCFYWCSRSLCTLYCTRPDIEGPYPRKRIQHTAFNNVKANLQEKKEIIIQVGYRENYTNEDQGQVQSAYFGQKSFSIFTTCCYLKVDSVILNENVTVISEANDQSRSAAMSRWRKVLSYLCSGKIPSRRIVNPSFCYRDLSWRLLSSGITTSAITGKGPWMVFEARARAHGWCSRHGQGPMDGVRGTGKGSWMVFETP